MEDMKEKIRKLRKLMGLTQKKFGEEIGVKAQTVYVWEKGTKTPQGSARKTLEDLYVKNGI